MNLSKALEQVKALKSGYDMSEEMMISYINTVEHMVLNEIVRGREGDDEIFNNYFGVDKDSEGGTLLFVPAPYDGIYAQYCAAQIDLLDEDGDRYLNDSIVFKDTYQSFKRYWWQTHRQKPDYRYHF